LSALAVIKGNQLDLGSDQIDLGWDKVEKWKHGGLDDVGDGGTLQQHVVDGTLERRLVYTKAGGGIALRIEINQQGAPLGQSEARGKIDCGRRFPDSALLVYDRQRPTHRFPPGLFHVEHTLRVPRGTLPRSRRGIQPSLAALRNTRLFRVPGIATRTISNGSWGGGFGGPETAKSPPIFK
jgi:hypothetical protein